MSKGTSFAPGKHSFYGMMHIYVEVGNPCVNGASLKPGFCGDIFAPLYGLPYTFESNEAFAMTISSLSQDVLSPKEIKYYLPKSPPDGFKEICAGVFYSQIIHGCVYQQALINFVENTLNKKPSKIFIAGNKGAGKSTLSRIVANKVISRYGHVGFLDLDPGQPEISLPGSISFSVLDTFILSPPERHSHLAQLSYFYGSSSMSDNIEHFQRCLEELIKGLPSDIFIIVNSFGWVADLGLTLHQEFLDAIQPENVIMLTKPEEKSSPIRGYMFRTEVTAHPGPMQVTPKEQREIRICSHFLSGRGSISCQQPYVFSLRNIHVGFVCVDVKPTETLTALNGSIVALCSDMRAFPQNRKYLTLLKEPYPIRVVGYGLVRAIDKENGLLYVISRESYEIIGNVNTILMGAINTPGDFYLDTPRADPNYLAIGLMKKPGASTEPLALKQTPVFD